ncbi:MAG: hypothetical protein ACYCW6_00100 [Candidatus Xenobia bacterium]
MMHGYELQLLPAYHARLDHRFLALYESAHTNQEEDLYGHITAGSCGLSFADYDECIRWDGQKAVVDVNFADTRDPTYATSDRNPHSVAIAVDGFHDASPSDLGKVRCHPEQIRLFVQRCAFHVRRLLMRFGRCLTHAEAADDKDGWHDPRGEYGPSHGWMRWDWDYWIDPVTLALEAPLKPCPVGWLAFADWWRGEIALALQELTKHLWDPQQA